MKPQDSQVHKKNRPRTDRRLVDSHSGFIALWALSRGEAIKKEKHYFNIITCQEHLWTEWIVSCLQVVISECSGAIGKFREKVLSINPQKTHLFTFDIHAYDMKGGSHYCAGKKVKELKRYFPFSLWIKRQEDLIVNMKIWHQLQRHPATVFRKMSVRRSNGYRQISTLWKRLPLTCWAHLYYLYGLYLTIGWFSNRTGTSVDDGASKLNNWIDQWQSGKSSTGSRV